MPQLHMPLQSGSDRILKAMRRSYRSERFLGILDRVRERMPNAAITTDIIVGFPGETDEDFEDTMRVVEQARFTSAFTFQYSIREGTPAATMPDQVPKAVVQERYERLIALQERISLEENQKQVGRELQVLVSMGEGKKDAATHRLTGRAEDNRLVHFELPAGSDVPRPGDVVSVVVTHAAPFHLLADAPDGAPLRIRRTRAGDAWDRTQAESCGIPSPAGEAGASEGRLARASDAAHRGVSARPRALGDRRCDRHRQDRALARSRRGARGAGHGRPRSSTPTRCSCTAAWTSAPPSCRSTSGAASRIISSTCSRSPTRPPWPGISDAARNAIDEIHVRGADAILVGGSGLYVSSVLFDFRFPPHDEALRAELETELETQGPGILFARLRDADPATAARIDPKNGRRIVRALEVLAQGAQTHGAALPEAPVLWRDDTRIIGVAVPREELVAAPRCARRGDVGRRPPRRGRGPARRRASRTA